MFKCEYCQKDPTLHSFKILSEKGNHTTYMSTISEATDKNVEQIIFHIKGFLKCGGFHTTTDKTWSWIIDSSNFKIHMHTLLLTKELMKVINEFDSTLTEVRIINLNFFMKSFVRVCRSFLTKKLKI
jgi:hypothetical protein